MRARIRTAEFRLEFDGDPAVWNEFVRPVVGGPEAGGDAPREDLDPVRPPQAVRAPETGRAAAAEPAPQRPQQRAAAAIEPHGDPAELYRRLAASGGRRGEKDAVVAAVWFLAGSTGDATPEEVQQHFLEHGAFTGARVKPVMLKHVSRTHLLERAERSGAVRLSPKGVEYVRTRLVGAG